MIRRPPRSTRTDTFFPYTTLFRSGARLGAGDVQPADVHRRLVPEDELGHDPHGDADRPERALLLPRHRRPLRSEEHTSELQSLMRISYAVFCLKKKKTTNLCNSSNLKNNQRNES